MNTIIIFDLDDTLVNCKMKIPRQTYHMLNKFKQLNYFIGIITYNFMVELVAKETNLKKYTSHIFYKDIDRNILFENGVKVLTLNINVSLL
jgi:hydroxymethylpyrimidine pyrophosphatase-like HAD family hydrolase